MNLEERLQQIETAAKSQGGIALRSIDHIVQRDFKLLRALEIVSVPYWWDSKLLPMILDEDLVAEASTIGASLEKLSITEKFLPRESAHNIHEVARRALLHRLFLQARLETIALRVLKATPLTNDQPGDIIEHLYLLLLADPEEGEKALEVQWRMWDDNGRWASLQELALMLEANERLFSPLALARALLRSATIRATRRSVKGLASKAAESSEIFAQLGQRRPQAQALNLLGSILANLGHLEEAQKHFEHALAIRQDLAKVEPDSAPLQRELSVSHGKLGTLATSIGDYTKARFHIESSLAITKCLATSTVKLASADRDLSVSHNKFGVLAEAQSDYKEARHHYVKALKLRIKLACGDSHNVAWQRDLSVAHSKVGVLALRTGNFKDAQKHLVAAHNIRERLVGGDPSNAAWKHDLATSEEWLGRLAQEQGKIGHAKNHYLRQFEITKQLVNNDLLDLTWRHDLWKAFGRLAEIAKLEGSNSDEETFRKKAAEMEHYLAENDWPCDGRERDLFFNC